MFEGFKNLFKKKGEKKPEERDKLKENPEEKAEEVEGGFEAAADKASEKFEEAKEVLEEKVEATEETLEKIAETTAEKGEEKLEEFSQVLDEKIEKGKYHASEIVDKSAEKIEETVEKGKEFVEETAEKLSEKIEKKDKKEEKTKKAGFFEKIVNGLKKTGDNLSGKIDDILFSFKKIDEDMLEELEEILITADMGMSTVMTIMDNLRERIKLEKTQDPSDVKIFLKEEILKIMDESVESNELVIEPAPAIILVVGVNGVGKTTIIGKLAHKLKDEGKSVLLAAGDTFRAAAIEQLQEWGTRSGIEVISHEESSDPAAVIFDAIRAARARKTDVLICDTAGRLHNKANLINELGKIFKVVEKEYPEATRETLLVLDATTGQNALSQAKTFKEVCDLTGIALTKLDGTAKGGVVIALQKEIGIPVKLVGVGEGIDDLQPFDNKAFVEGIFRGN